jgi:hypothetical protein
MAIYINYYLYLMILVMPTLCWSLWLSNPRQCPSTYLRSNSKCCPIFPIIPLPHMLLLFEIGEWLDCWLFFIRCLQARRCACYRNNATTTWWWRPSDQVERGSWVDCALYKSLLLLGERLDIQAVMFSLDQELLCDIDLHLCHGFLGHIDTLLTGSLILLSISAYYGSYISIYLRMVVLWSWVL